jgi:hypothetical protein
MLLVVSKGGPLAKRLRKEARRRSWDVAFARPDDDDLFMKALRALAQRWRAARARARGPDLDTRFPMTILPHIASPSPGAVNPIHGSDGEGKRRVTCSATPGISTEPFV